MKPATLRAIPGHPDYYAGDDGHVWSWKTSKLRRLVSTLGRDGYPAVHLYSDGQRVRKRVHALVCRAFHGEEVTVRPDGSRRRVVRHLDGDRENNRPCNLQWGTYAENYADRKAHEAEWAHYEAMGPPDDTEDDPVPF